MSRRTFHRNALGTLLTVAGGVLLVRAACLWSNDWRLLVLQVVAGAAFGAWVARRNYPELRVPDAAVTGGVGAMLVVGISHMNHAAPPLAELVASAVLAATSAAGTTFALRQNHGPAGRILRTIQTGAIVWAASLGTVAVLAPVTNNDEILILGIFVGGFAASMLVPAASVWSVVVGFLAGVVAPATGVLVLMNLGRHTGLAMLIAGIAALVGSVFVALGAGLASLVKFRPALADVELVPQARIER